MGKIAFDFAEKGQPMGYAVNLALSMYHFKTAEQMTHLISHAYFSEQYSPEKLVNVVDMLADPQKCLVIVTSKSFEDETLPIEEKWYKFNYSKEKFSEDRLAQLSAASVPDSGKKLDLPPPNSLIPTNFEILPEDSDLSAAPKLIQQWEGIADLWYRKDDRFKKPKIFVGCKIYTPDLEYGASPLATVFAEVWKRIL